MADGGKHVEVQATIWIKMWQDTDSEETEADILDKVKNRSEWEDWDLMDAKIVQDEELHGNVTISIRPKEDK